VPGIIILVNPVSLHHGILRLKPGGRKKLKDGFGTQGLFLLFRYCDIFSEKKTIIFKSNLWKCGKPLTPPVDKSLKNKKHFSTTYPQVP